MDSKNETSKCQSMQATNQGVSIDLCPNSLYKKVYVLLISNIYQHACAECLMNCCTHSSRYTEWGWEREFTCCSRSFLFRITTSRLCVSFMGRVKVFPESMSMVVLHGDLRWCNRTSSSTYKIKWWELYLIFTRRLCKITFWARQKETKTKNVS